jgi:hypothetical protein
MLPTNLNRVLSLQMKCSTEEFRLEGTEDCWVPPPLSQSSVACKWGNHSFCPEASSFRYRLEVKLLHLWPNKASDFGICHHARRRLMPPLKVLGVSCCLITSLLGNLYTIIYILFYSCIYNSQISIYRQIANGCFGDSRLLPTLQMDANECRLMYDFQRLSRTAFLHFSVPLSSERQLNCWVT